MDRMMQEWRCPHPGLVLAACLVFAAPSQADVGLEWRPQTQSIALGEEAEIGLYAVSESGDDQLISIVETILQWNPTQLELVALNDNGPYDWLSSHFPNDELQDGLNCPCPPGALPLSDGDAWYIAFGNPTQLPTATPDGLLITSFRFKGTSGGLALVDMPANVGDTHTRVFDGETAGLVITGTLGPPAEIDVVDPGDCLMPSVEGTGSRTLGITPNAAIVQALHVTGVSGSPDVTCVDAYVQEDGSLGPDPVFLTPSEWSDATDGTPGNGSVGAYGLDIIPGATYSVKAECDDNVSFPDTGTTFPFGDVDNDSFTNLNDALLIILGIEGDPAEGITLDAMDLEPCQPNRIINLADALQVVLATEGAVYTDFCPATCP